MTTTTTEQQKMAEEAKAVVLLAFRNRPIEDIHAGNICPTCSGDPEYSHITDPEMKTIMKHAVDQVYTLMRLKEDDPEKFNTLMQWGLISSWKWDEPVFQEIDI